jgi:hypothetical protein
MSSKPQTDILYDEPEWVFPYSGMGIGDSFFIPTMKPAYMSYIIDTTSKKVGLKMRVFTTTENGLLGVRAWRIK